jgi:hypothetical protein
VKTSKLCSNQKSDIFKIDFRFFIVTTLCLDDNFAHSWHSISQLHLECFSNSLEGVPTYAEHLLAAFPSLCSPTHPKQSQFGILLGSPFAVAKAAATLPGVHTKHEA